MHSFNLKVLKIAIAILTISFALNLVTGMSFLRDNFYFRIRFFEMQWNWIKNEIEFEKFYYGKWEPWQLRFRQKEAVASTESAKSVPVLLYHGVIDEEGWEPDGVNISQEDFKQHMFALKKSGYQTIKLEDYIAFSKGEKELPEKSILLTFDDARKDSFYRADPILKTVGYSAVMYVITGRSLNLDDQESPFHLSITELKKMARSSRWQVGSHTRNGHEDIIINETGEKGHFLTNLMWKNDEKRMETREEYIQRIERDLKNSKLDIETKLNVVGNSFAYPFGDFGQASENFPLSRELLPQVVDMVFPLSFRQSGSSQHPANYAEGPSLSKRINVDSDISAQHLLDILEGNREKSLSTEALSIKYEDWQKGWGDWEVVDDALFIGNNEWEDSAMTFLGGSYMWSDYDLQAKITLVKGTNFSISGRFKDENNYALCEYSPTRMVLSQRSGGKEKPFIERDMLTNITARPSDISMRIKGNWAGCYLNGKLIVSGILENNLNRGGIGFKLWDSTGKGAIIKIENLKIKKI